MDPTPLDNMVFETLIGPQRRLAQVSTNGAAARFRPDVSPFCGIANEDAASWAGLAEVLGDDGVGVFMGPRLSRIPDGWECLLEEIATQWVAESLPAAPTIETTVLGPQDAQEMVELATLTEPGPFLEATVETGRYVGVRRDGRLIAMAGERLRAGDWVEVSGVCVHPSAQREGLGAALTLSVAERIRSGGERAMLHVRQGNDNAVALYRKLGFRWRADRFVYALRPDRASRGTA